MLDKNAALIIIDVQQAFLHSEWGERNNPEAEKNIAKLLKTWREKEALVIYIQHTSDSPESLFHPSNSGFTIQDTVKPRKSELIITKNVNSAFIGTNLQSILESKEIKTVIITGLTTPHCVSTTTRMSGNLGFHTYLISDATAAFGITDHNGHYYNPKMIHDLSLATIHDEFATVLKTDQLIEKMST